jgi:hypothetical protein
VNSHGRKARARWRAKRRGKPLIIVIEPVLPKDRDAKRKMVERALSGRGPPLHGYWTNSELMQAQHRRCYLCDTVLQDFAGNHIRAPSRDHVRPRHPEKGRTLGSFLNILLAHTKCNNRKGRRVPRPCEVLFLEAINEIVAATRNQSGGSAIKASCP